MSELKYKVGDYVSITDDAPGSPYEGKVVMVYSDKQTHYPYRVSGLDFNGWLFHEDELTLSTEENYIYSLLIGKGPYY